MLLNIDDYRRAARRTLPGFVFDYVDGAADDKHCLARNRRDLDAITLVPRVLRDTRATDTAVEVFGTRWRFPFAIAPTGLNGLVLPDTACPFPTETNTPELTGAGTVNFFVQSPVAGSYFLVASLQAASSCGLPASVALPNPCHPRLIDPASYVFGPYPLTTSAAGTHSAAWTVTVPALGSHYWLLCRPRCRFPAVSASARR